MGLGEEGKCRIRKRQNMKFSQLILTKAGGIFQKHKFQVGEPGRDYLQLQSEYLTIIIAHDFRDNSNTLFWAEVMQRHIKLK